jgi:hypothetical protein
MSGRALRTLGVAAELKGLAAHSGKVLLRVS